MSSRRERLDEFVESRAHGGQSFSGGLLVCGVQLLASALEDRRREVYRTPHSHHTNHAVGSILLLTAALEAWLNEVIDYTSRVLTSPEDIRELAGRPILDKFCEVPQRLGGARLPDDADLESVTSVRNEIAHFLPRGSTQWSDDLPSALQPLQRAGLLITSGRSGVDFHWTQKLHSYSLAYWSWSVVDIAVERLLGALLRLNEPTAGVAGGLIQPAASHNFRMYRRVCPPEALDRFDEQHGLDITSPTGQA